MSDYPNLLVSFPRVNAYIQLRYDVNQKKKGLAMSDYPNIDAVIQGCVSRIQAEWPELRNEVAAMRKQIEVQKKQLQAFDEVGVKDQKQIAAQKEQISRLTAELAMAPYPHQLKRLQEQVKAQKDVIVNQKSELRRLEKLLANQNKQLNNRGELIEQLRADIDTLQGAAEVVMVEPPESQSAASQWRSIALQHSGLLVEKDKEIKRLEKLLTEAEEF